MGDVKVYRGELNQACGVSPNLASMFEVEFKRCRENLDILRNRLEVVSSPPGPCAPGGEPLRKSRSKFRDFYDELQGVTREIVAIRDQLDI